jgi:predicted ribonuclease YlaK
MVAPCVIEELDGFKTGSNQRRRDRARLALNHIEKASRETGLALVVREAPVRVRIVISAAAGLDWGSYPNLDGTRPDDRLVAEALAFGEGAVIFSHDTGPRIRARIVGLEAYEPLAAWMLPSEMTDDQRKIGRLERELELAQQRHPKIVAHFPRY